MCGGRRGVRRRERVKFGLWGGGGVSLVCMCGGGFFGGGGRIGNGGWM